MVRGLLSSVERRAIASACVALGLTACGGANQTPAASPSVKLTAYNREQATVFDDSIDPAAVGLSLDAAASAADPLLKRRTEDADFVVRARVSTVTLHDDGVTEHYELRAVSSERLAGRDPGAAPIVLPFLEHNPSAGIIKGMQQRLSGKTFIIFVREFASKSGPEVHFHIAPNDPEVVRAVKTAATLEELE